MLQSVQLKFPPYLQGQEVILDAQPIIKTMEGNPYTDPNLLYISELHFVVLAGSSFSSTQATISASQLPVPTPCLLFFLRTSLHHQLLDRLEYLE
jgi:hypothetical protein